MRNVIRLSKHSFRNRRVESTLLHCKIQRQKSIYYHLDCCLLSGDSYYCEHFNSSKAPVRMATDYYEKCIYWKKWRIVGITIGWLMFVLSFFLVISSGTGINFFKIGEFNIELQKPTTDNKYQFYLKIAFARKFDMIFFL